MSSKTQYKYVTWKVMVEFMDSFTKAAAYIQLALGADLKSALGADRDWQDTATNLAVTAKDLQPIPNILDTKAHTKACWCPACIVGRIMEKAKKLLLKDKPQEQT